MYQGINRFCLTVVFCILAGCQNPVNPGIEIKDAAVKPKHSEVSRTEPVKTINASVNRNSRTQEEPSIDHGTPPAPTTIDPANLPIVEISGLTPSVSVKRDTLKGTMNLADPVDSRW